MDKIIVYVDDADYALQQLTPMNSGGAAAPGTHWILVACAPRMTQHISKWVSHAARQSWRAKWSDKLFAQVVPGLQQRGDQVSTMLAEGVLIDMTRQLLLQQGMARVLDARRPKFGQDLQPVTVNQPTSSHGSWTVPGAVAGMGAVLVLAAE